jgi:hypothetical protein
MDLLKVLRLRHIRKGPDQGAWAELSEAAPSGSISVPSQPGTLLRDRTYLRRALHRITKGRKIRPGFVGDVRLWAASLSRPAPRRIVNGCGQAARQARGAQL